MRLLLQRILLMTIAAALPSAAAPQDSKQPLEDRIRANQASAVGSLRSINTACVVYSATYGTGYPAALRYLGGPGPANARAADLIVPELAAGERNGYTFIFTPGKAVDGIVPTYTVQADPVKPGETGRWHFFTDESGVVRLNATAPASAADTPVGGVPHSGGTGLAKPGTRVAPEQGDSAGSASPDTTGKVKMDRAEMESRLVTRVAPQYPPLARQARIQGTVRLHAMIATDGTVESLEVLSGPSLLVAPALDAVRKWKYEPVLWNGQPAKVDTIIEVVFQLGDPPK